MPVATSALRGIHLPPGRGSGDQRLASFLRHLEEGWGVWPRPRDPDHHSKGLILAQNERWRHALHMQVERPARGVAQG